MIAADSNRRLKGCSFKRENVARPSFRLSQAASSTQYNYGFRTCLLSRRKVGC